MQRLVIVAFLASSMVGCLRAQGNAEHVLTWVESTTPAITRGSFVFQVLDALSLPIGRVR